MAAIGGNYPQPVLVNGYECWNCHDVAEAKNNVDPARPDPASATASPSATRPGAVVFGGALSALNGRPAAAASAQPPPATGAALDVTA